MARAYKRAKDGKFSKGGAVLTKKAKLKKGKRTLKKSGKKAMLKPKAPNKTSKITTFGFQADVKRGKAVNYKKDKAAFKKKMKKYNKQQAARKKKTKSRKRKKK